MKKITRRSFINKSLFTAGVLGFPTIVPSSVISKNPPSDRMLIGAIGTGRMGRGDMKAVIHQGFDVNARVIAVCDVDKNRAQIAQQTVEKIYSKKKNKKKGANKNSKGCDLYYDFRELLERKDIDGVTISTPDHWHAIPAIAAANAGKDIYIQKPLTYSIEEGKQLIKAVRNNNVILQTGSQQRSSIYFRKTCELVRNGRIGKLQAIEVYIPEDKGNASFESMPVPANLDYDFWLGPTLEVPYTEMGVHPNGDFSRPGWLQIEQFCRGMITGWGAHMFDIAQWGMGTDMDSGPIEIEANAEFPDRGIFNVHTKFTGKAVYKNGVVLTSTTGAAGVKFIGDKSWVHVTRSGFDAPDRKIFREKFGPDEVHLYESKNHMLNFLECMRSRKEPIAPVEAGHRSNSICVLFHIAMKLGRKLNWNPEIEQFINDDEANKMLDYPHQKPWDSMVANSFSRKPLPKIRLNKEWINKIKNIAPDKPSVHPKKDHKVLLFSLSTGFKHWVIPHTDEVIKILSEKSRAFQVVRSRDINMFLPEKLKDFDAVILNNNCSKNPGRNLIFDALKLKKENKDLSEEELLSKADLLEKSLINFVANGKGLMAIHGAIVFNNNSPAFSEMLGGSFDFHPPQQEFQVDLVDPEHTLVKAFKGKPFIHTDELYIFKGAYLKKNFRPLLSVDTSKIFQSKKVSRKMPALCYVSWIKKHGKGRVFYVSPSHNAQSFDDPGLLHFYLDGIQYILGDLKCDDSPVKR